jgi:hypothetical protein
LSYIYLINHTLNKYDTDLNTGKNNYSNLLNKSYNRQNMVSVTEKIITEKNIRITIINY